MGFSTAWREEAGDANDNPTLSAYVIPTVTLSEKEVVGTDVVDLMTCMREFDWYAADNANSLTCVYTEWSQGSDGFLTSVVLMTLQTSNATTYPAEETDKEDI